MSSSVAYIAASVTAAVVSLAWAAFGSVDDLHIPIMCGFLIVVGPLWDLMNWLVGYRDDDDNDHSQR